MKQNLNLKTLLAMAIGGLLSLPSMAAETAPAVEESLWDNPLNTLLMISASGLFILLLTLGYIINKMVSTKGLWINKNLVGALLIGLFTLSSFPASAAELNPEPSLVNGTTYLLISINVVLLAVVLYLKRLAGQVLKIATGIEPKSVSYAPSFSDLTDAVPIENEAEVMTDHEYDGIRELDNNLPPWWVGMFYLTILFAVVYIPYYHLGAGNLQEEEYLAEVAQAEEQKAAYMAMKGSMVDENNAEVLTSSSALKNGQNTFLSKCAACHGQAGEGMAGPNLTDAYWKHGGDIKDIFKTIKYGVVDKGMISWQDQMSPVEINEVASYIVSLQGTNPANGKAPEGDLYEPAKKDSTLTQE